MILDIWSKYGKSVILPAVICAAIILYFLFSKEPNSPEPILLSAANEQHPIEQTPEQVEAPQQALAIIVDVKGAVKHPGVYPFTTEDRIMDAIQAAGGYLDAADTRAINHAQKLSDELVIYVPKKGEEMEAVAAVVSSNPSSTNTAAKSDSVNINTANESELTTLPGIGPSKAAAIIAYREENGSFQTVDALKNVSGIGDKTFERLQQLIVVK